MCVCVCVCECECVCVCVSVSECVCVYVYVRACMSLLLKLTKVTHNTFGTLHFGHHCQHP